MQSLKRWCLVSIAFSMLLSGANADSSATIRQSVFEMIEVPATGDGVKKAVEWLRARPEGTLAVSNLSPDEWSKIAEFITLGNAADELMDQTIAAAAISKAMPFFSFESAEYGSSNLRMSLLRGLWSTAKQQLEAERGVKARGLSRAAVALGAVDYSGFGAGALVEFLHDPKASELLALEKSKIAPIASAVLKLTRPTPEFVDAIGSAAAALDGMIHADKNAPQEQAMANFITGLRTAYALSPLTPGDRWRLANMLWRFCCAARANGNLAALEAARTFVSAQKQDPNTSKMDVKWLDEALATNGPMPRSAGVGVISQPNDLKPKQ